MRNQFFIEKYNMELRLFSHESKVRNLNYQFELRILDYAVYTRDK